MKILIAVLLVFAFASTAVAEDAPKKEDKPTPAKDEKKDEKAKDFIETEIGCFRCCFKAGKECAPACRIDGKIYILKVLDTADEKTKKVVETCSGKLAAKKAKIKGKPAEDKEPHWYYVGELLMAD
ncbi:MAG TPA: hypothetical protein VEJ63_12875 [Planctomycetota bacterium]|nr:hypothetical protein [Planctomycetota bacterium]